MHDHFLDRLLFLLHSCFFSEFCEGEAIAPQEFCDISLLLSASACVHVLLRHSSCRSIHMSMKTTADYTPTHQCPSMMLAQTSCLTPDQLKGRTFFIDETDGAALRGCVVHVIKDMNGRQQVLTALGEGDGAGCVRNS